MKESPTNAIDPSGEFIWFAVGVVALILLYPAIANAPASGDPTYRNNPMDEMAADIRYMVAAGSFFVS